MNIADFKSFLGYVNLAGKVEDVVINKKDDKVQIATTDTTRVVAIAAEGNFDIGQTMAITKLSQLLRIIKDDMDLSHEENVYLFKNKRQSLRWRRAEAASIKELDDMVDEKMIFTPKQKFFVVKITPELSASIREIIGYDLHDEITFETKKGVLIAKVVSETTGNMAKMALDKLEEKDKDIELSVTFISAILKLVLDRAVVDEKTVVTLTLGANLPAAIIMVNPTFNVKFFIGNLNKEKDKNKA